MLIRSVEAGPKISVSRACRFALWRGSTGQGVSTQGPKRLGGYEKWVARTNDLIHSVFVIGNVMSKLQVVQG